MSIFRIALSITLLQISSLAIAAENEMSLKLRSRVETAPKSGRFHTVTKKENWNPTETAIIVCDMWDAHHCLNAVRRGRELAPRMNSVLRTAREQGVLIIHAPSSCMDAYKSHPGRARAKATPLSDKLPQDIEKWLDSIPVESGGEYPIDQTDGGEDDDLVEHAEWAKELESRGLDPRSPWKRQTDMIGIDTKRDYISDDGKEIWSILEANKRDNVILLGVHTNMCVLGRPFGLRQMSKNGKNVVLMRDMTDTMYNPKMRPFVSHFTGTDLIIEHIEKWVCATITSDQIIGGKTFKFKNDKRPHLVIITAEREYKTEQTLPKFALQYLGQSFRVSHVFADANDRNSLPGIELLDDADLALISVRRRVLPESQMKSLRTFVESGKPIVGIRTANHAFLLRNESPKDGLKDWQDWDAEIFGGSYTNHHGRGPEVTISKSDVTYEHDILAGIDVSKLRGKGSLYQVRPLRDEAIELLKGEIPNEPAESIAWVFKSKYGNPTFYTSLGHVGDFAQPEFNELLSNALHWAAGIKPPATSLVAARD